MGLSAQKKLVIELEVKVNDALEKFKKVEKASRTAINKAKANFARTQKNTRAYVAGVKAEQKAVIDASKAKLSAARKELGLSRIANQGAKAGTPGRASLDDARSKVIGAKSNLDMAQAKASEQITKAQASANDRLASSKNNLDKATKKANSAIDRGRANLDKSKGALTGARMEEKKMSQQMKSASGTFQGWAMSLMFAGMAIQRVFVGIGKSAMATFNEITSSVENSANGFQMLEGTFKELQFVIGAALEPVAMLLMPIVDRVIDWVSRNQELTKQFVIWGTVLGTVLMVLGMATLAIVNGIIPAVKLLGLYFSGTVAPAIASVTSALGIGLLPIIGLLVLAIIAFAALWKSNLGGIRDFVKSVAGNIWETFKGMFSNLKEIFKGVFLLFEGLFSGDLDKIMAGAIKIIFNAIGLIAKIITGLGDIMSNVFAFGLNVIKDMFFSIIKIIISAINKLIGVANKVPGVNIGMIGTGIFDKAMEADISYVSGDKTKERNEAIDAILNKLEQQTVQVVVELDGDKVAESAATRINQGVDSGSL